MPLLWNNLWIKLFTDKVIVITDGYILNYNKKQTYLYIFKCYVRDFREINIFSIWKFHQFDRQNIVSINYVTGSF